MLDFYLPSELDAIFRDLHPGERAAPTKDSAPPPPSVRTKTAHKRFVHRPGRPLVLGHRGVMALHQENSLAGFRRALELGLDGVELDVKLTKDNRVVVFHDDETERLTGVRGRLSAMTWDEVSRLRLQRHLSIGQGRFTAYSRAERIPLLEEVLAEFGGRLLLNIELKATAINWAARHLGARTAALLKQAGIADSVIVTSFDPMMLWWLQSEHPTLTSGLGYHSEMVKVVATWLAGLRSWQPLLNFDRAERCARRFIYWALASNFGGRLTHSTVLCLEDAMITEEIVRKFQQREMLVGAYTMFPGDLTLAQPSLEEQLRGLSRLVALGVDWLETDEPELALQLLTVADQRRAV